MESVVVHRRRFELIPNRLLLTLKSPGYPLLLGLKAGIQDIESFLRASRGAHRGRRSRVFPLPRSKAARARCRTRVSAWGGGGSERGLRRAPL